MALELQLPTLEGVDESLVPLYVEKDGAFHLDVAGVPDVKGLTSTLAKQKQAILDGKESAASLQAKLDEIEADKIAALEKAGKTKEVDELRYEKYKTATDERLARRDARINALEGSTLENIFRKVAVDAGVHKTAVEDALLRAGNIFSLDEKGNAVQLGEDGNPVLGADGTNNYSPAEWMQTMKESSPHWFPAGSSGGDAKGGSGGDPTPKTSGERIKAGLKKL